LCCDSLGSTMRMSYFPDYGAYDFQNQTGVQSRPRLASPQSRAAGL
jgi:hypothetical protein